MILPVTFLSTLPETFGIQFITGHLLLLMLLGEQLGTAAHLFPVVCAAAWAEGGNRGSAVEQHCSERLKRMNAWR